jgi:hypothetical protein
MTPDHVQLPDPASHSALVVAGGERARRYEGEGSPSRRGRASRAKHGGELFQAHGNFLFGLNVSTAVGTLLEDILR